MTPLPGRSAGDGKVRLNRYLASAGLSSRRGADGLIAGGRVRVNGEVVRELGVCVDPESDEVLFDGVPVVPERRVYLLFNKPKGVVCTNAKNEQRKRVIDCVPEVRGRLFTVGRLDADSEGLVLLTNDGDFAQSVSHPSRGVPKTYAVLVRGRVDQEAVQKARGGVWLSDGKTAGAHVRIERTSRDRTYLKIVLREGRNREIRRVFAKLDHAVLSLKRVRIGPLTLHGLGRGRYRYLSRRDIDAVLESASAGDLGVVER